MKKGFLLGTALVLIAAVLIGFFLYHPSDPESGADDIFRTEGRGIQIMGQEGWEPFRIRGVNIGTGYPGQFPNDLNIDGDTYYRWFQKIGAMNTNTIRVYQLQPPSFYTALADYNAEAESPLYLIQGVDFSDYRMYTDDNILEDIYLRPLLEETRNVVRALHGDRLTLDRDKSTLRSYTGDVSPYVLGYVLGVEWDEMFVSYVCRSNDDIAGYSGRYLTCGEDANAFEIFLARWGDDLLTFEQDTYGCQKLMSFANWPSTDPLINEFELIPLENDRSIPDSEATVDLEHIHPTAQMTSGMFASYNVYPYFPYFLQYGPYTEFVDSTGRPNPYLGYLTALVQHHSCPVIVTEFGVPASRSPVYEDKWFGRSHGGLNEEEQGHALEALYGDIRRSGCAGALVFTWQDEWYKTAWNEKMISNPDRRAYWSNAQCAEQSFGLMAFEPGTETDSVWPDGDFSEWGPEDVVSVNGTTELSIRSDERYLHFLVRGFSGDQVCIALDVTPKTGIEQTDTIHFSRPVDFVLFIRSRDSGILLTDRFYDSLIYSAMGGYDDTSVYMIRKLAREINSKDHIERRFHHFWPVSRAKGSIDSTRSATWLQDYAGLLYPGNGNPDSPLYDSSADFCFGPDGVEIRLPWQLLNFTDPSTASILDDWLSTGYQIRSLALDSIYACPFDPQASSVEEFGAYALHTWEEPVFHERLKKSYYVVQRVFEEDSHDNS